MPNGELSCAAAVLLEKSVRVGVSLGDLLASIIILIQDTDAAKTKQVSSKFTKMLKMTTITVLTDNDQYF